jgi:hypothetical protein
MNNITLNTRVDLYYLILTMKINKNLITKHLAYNVIKSNHWQKKKKKKRKMNKKIKLEIIITKVDL